MSYLLLVDDDRDDIALTLLGFRDERFECEVSVARDGKEALDFLLAACAERRPLPDVILLDLKMPRMDGLELLTRIKSDPRLNAIPVAILTSSGHETDIYEAKRLGAAGYLRKPSNLRDYAGIVAQLRRLMAAKSAR